jgi:hypothetical protein
MKCIDCEFRSDPKELKPDAYPSVRCLKGLWDHKGVPQWYAWGSVVRNRGPVRRFGDTCTVGEPRKKGEHEAREN